MPAFAALVAPRFHYLWAAIIMAAILIAVGWSNAPDPIAFSDTDEAMRLVQLRAFLAGQSWFDLVPHRLDPGVDVPMHWSRFVDLSMAMIYAPLALVTSQPVAERWLAILWPPLMLIVCALPLARIARRFGGQAAVIAAILLLVSARIVNEFVPGRIDHHSAQMAAALLAIAATMARNHVSAAVLAGCATAFALSLGIETLPYLIILACFFASDFMRGVRLASVRAYALSLACAAIALFILTTAPRFYFYTACDALTINMLAAVASGGLMLGLAASWYQDRETTDRQRLFTLVAIGAAAIASSLALEPRCIGGVIATFDPNIRPLWFNHIHEVTSAFEMASRLPAHVALAVVLPLLALVAIGAQWKTIMRRDDQRIMLACFAAAVLIMMIQVRGGFYANMFALPFVAMGLVYLYRHYALFHAMRTFPVTASLILGCLPFAVAYTARVIETSSLKQEATSHGESDIRAQSTDDQCQTPASLKELAQLRPGLVLAPIDMGSFIMLETPHAVISAPYHRFDRGIVLGQSIIHMMGLPQAEAAIRQRGIEYIALCRDGNWPALEEAYIRNKPEWLDQVSSPDAPMAILKVKPLASAAKAAHAGHHFAE